ncbi:MAG: FtsK/SpoIIIE domain-containing protein [Ilumatobacteraceae bacterium]
MPLPIHVVVVDDTELLTPEELTELLVHGPANGIVAVTVDERLSPEGVGATLTIPSTDDAADRCTFQSRHQPRLDGVIVAAVAADVGEAAARRLAGLRPTISDEQGIAGDVVHLVDLIESDGALTPDAVRLRWDTIGPRTAVPVGAATGTTMVVDLVRDGPHGLVGGTSGSGKTEFLKTLFCGLALNNHPDDLSIVIVDFKGGVDHEAVKPLPHVIDVATNLDIEQFKRTIVLLKAESMRRQDLLASAGASNVDSYRLARASKPELPPLPRLLVVVDEFGELLASEGGREQLKELESITRIGRALGLHLLLVTQNFDGNLPAQIDANAGMRVCLRVQKPAHSKAVLDSGVAATIADRNVGRAYARFHGRDLVEFQTARVAGRRRDLAGSSTPVTARLVPFSVLSTAPPESRPEDVPVEETDMYVILQSIRAAAEATGWQRSAVPWPASLPERISLLSLGGRVPAAVTAVGVSDLPEQQRRGLCTFSERDQQVALLGGPSAPLPEILTTYATALAVGRTADDVHVYGIDLIGRSLSQLGELPHCGGIAVRNDNLALRMLRWLTQVVAERKAAVATSGSSTVWEHAALGGELPPQIVLLVSGADRLLSTSDGPTSNLLGPLVSLMTEAIGVRVQIVLAGLPRIVAHRLGTNIERRFVFQLADPGEYSGLGAPKSARADLLIPRRAVETSTGRLVQFAQLAAPDEPEGAMVRAIAGRLPAAVARPPKVFADITWPMPWSAAPLGALTPPAHLVVPVPVGIDTEDGGWLWIDAEDDGPVFSVVGGPRSGRSATLHAIARLAAGQGHAVLNVALSRRSPLSTSDDPALGRRVTPGQVAAALAETPGRVVVLYDDLRRLPDGDCIEAAADQRARVLMVVSGAPDLLDSRTGMLRPLPVSRAGIVLAPSGNYDGNAVGLKRVPADALLNPRPGRGLLVVGGEPVPIQVPHLDGRNVPDGRPPADLSGGLRA